ncbi:hypothetical protein SATMO3_17410 [Sporomusa aerivorans]
MFLGEITAVYVDEAGLTDGNLDPKKINPIIMMYPGYFKLGQAIGTVFQDGMAYKKSLG